MRSQLLRHQQGFWPEFIPPRRFGALPHRTEALSIGLPTLIGLAPMLGHRLDDRRTVADRQTSDLASGFARASERRLPAQAEPQDFFVAPLDILPFRRAGQQCFQLLELNGTGIGGITNMPTVLVEDILDTIAEIGDLCEGPSPLVLVASSGRESQGESKPSHLLHEKLLFVDRIARSLEHRFGACDVIALDTLVADGGWRWSSRSTVLLGYTRELVERADVFDGVPRLFGRKVAAVVNDRFLYNLRTAHGLLDVDAFLPANRCYLAGADKATAYRHANSFASENDFDEVGATMQFDVCVDVDNLTDVVRARLCNGEQLVIKPSGTGHGDGIEFFFGGESEQTVKERIRRSLATVGQRYGQSAGFPYSVTEYLDADVVRAPGHALNGCKFELRIVVYRKGSVLRAVPSIAKVASEVWDPANPTRGSLINNVSASVRGGKTSGSDQLLPLCRPETLAALGLDEGVLTKLCCWATGYVAHVLHETRRSPARL
jgi:hypothetical protein